MPFHAKLHVHTYVGRKALQKDVTRPEEQLIIHPVLTKRLIVISAAISCTHQLGAHSALIIRIAKHAVTLVAPKFYTN